MVHVMGKGNSGLNAWRWDSAVYIYAVNSGKNQYARYIFGKEAGERETQRGDLRLEREGPSCERP